MKIQHHVKSALALFAFVAASQASAGQITLDSTLQPAYLTSGSYTGSFDGSAFLPANFNLNSVGFSFEFADDNDALISSAGVYTSSASTPVTTAATGQREATSTVTITNKTTYTVSGALESAAVSFGPLTIGGQTALSASSTGPVVQSSVTTQTYTYMQGSNPCTVADYNQKNSSCKRIVNYTITNTVTEVNTNNYTGSFALNGSLLGYTSLLDELMNTKKLGFGLNVTGDLNFVSAKLDIDYTPVAAPAGNDVPEPGSLALFGIAMLGAAAVRRARKQG